MVAGGEVSRRRTHVARDRRRVRRLVADDPEVHEPVRDRDERGGGWEPRSVRQRSRCRGERTDLRGLERARVLGGGQATNGGITLRKITPGNRSREDFRIAGGTRTPARDPSADERISTWGRQSGLVGGHVRNYGPGWKVARTTARRRDEVCQNCGHDGSERQLQVHHVIPVRAFRDGPETRKQDAHDIGNLVLLCHRCHSEAEHGELEFESEPRDPLCE
ncbi:HNH endonuclease signature motif containing protein [Halorientalis regularis]|uniref:HNH endonuclease n=1 Tax=Halorientalis regularis TaxID=660518 RepID=UPI000B891BB5